MFDWSIHALAGFAMSVLVSLAAVAGCGGPETGCGPGTERDGGECVPAEATVSCGAGTQQTTDGSCIVTDTSCGEGLVFHRETGQCVQDRAACTEGATFDGDAGCVPVAECGEHAIREEGVCRADTESLCGGGAIAFDADAGACVVTDEACEGGTELAASGRCVVAEEACAEGLALSDGGECEPTDEVCGEEAVFVDSEGLCLPEATCRSGDVVLDPDDDPSTPGICATEAEQAAENARVVESEPSDDGHNDPTLEGTAEELALDEADGTTAFTGTIAAPSDRDGDEAPEQDRDGFAFAAESGEWFQISVQSLGLPSPWFRVLGPEGFEREAMIGGGAAAARYLRVPADGTYTILVSPEVARSGDPEDTDRGEGPFGGDQWDYVGEIEPLESPGAATPSFPDDSPLAGNLVDLRDNFYELSDFAAGEVVEMSVEAIGDDASARLQVWRDEQTLTLQRPASPGDVFYALVPAGGSTPSILLDWASARGPHTGYELAVDPVSNTEVLGRLSAGSSIASSPRSLTSGDSVTYAVDVPQDHVIEITHANDENEEVDARVVDPTDTEVYAADPLEEVDDLNSAGEDDDGYFYTAQGGLHFIELTATDTMSNHEVTITAREPTSLGGVQPGGSVSQTETTSTAEYRSDYYRFRVDQPVRAEFTFEATAPSPADEIDHDLKLHDLRRRIVNLTDPDGRIAYERGTGSVTLGPIRLKTGEYLLGHGLEDALTEVAITGDIETAQDVEVEPNDTADNATDLPTSTSVVADAAVQDRDVYAFQVPSGGLSGLTQVELEAQRASEDAWQCRLEGPDGTTLDAVDQRDAGCVLFARLDQQGTYRLIVDFDGDERVRYDVERYTREAAPESEPNNRPDLADDTGIADGNLEAEVLGRWTHVDTTDHYSVEIPSSVPAEAGARLFVGITAQGPDPADGDLELRDSSGATVGTVGAQEAATVSVEVAGDESYPLVARGAPSSIATTDGAYAVTASVIVPDVTAGASPGVTIENDGTRHASTVNVSGCSHVDGVAVETDIEYTYRNGLSVWLRNPGGTTVQIWNENGGFDSNLVGTFPYAFTPANPLAAFAGASGNGDWRLQVEATDWPFTGTWNAWELQLQCN